jgi:hypothetical protein
MFQIADSEDLSAQKLHRKTAKRQHVHATLRLHVDVHMMSVSSLPFRELKLSCLRYLAFIRRAAHALMPRGSATFKDEAGPGLRSA